MLTPLENKEISEVLDRFGLSKNEQKVYLVLFSVGRSSLTPISQKVGLPLTTVQAIMKRLDSVGLLNVTMNKSRHLYEVHDPTVLKKLVEQQLTEVSSIVPLLKKLKTEEIAETKIRVFNRERVADIFLEALKSKDKLVYEIVSADNLQKIIGEKLHFTRRRLQEGVRLKSLRVESEEIKKYNEDSHIKELREAKFLPREFTFGSSIMFWDDYLVIFSDKSESLAVMMKSQSMVEMYLQFFEMLWSVSRKMDNKDTDY